MFSCSQPQASWLYLYQFQQYHYQLVSVPPPTIFQQLGCLKVIKMQDFYFSVWLCLLINSSLA